MGKKDNDDLENEYEDDLGELSDEGDPSYDEDVDQDAMDGTSDEALDAQEYSDEIDAEGNIDETEDESEEDEIEVIQGEENQKTFLQKYFNIVVGGGFALFLVIVFFIQFGNPFASSEPAYASVPPLSRDVIRGNFQQPAAQAEERPSVREADLASLSKAEREAKPFLTAPNNSVSDAGRAGTSFARQTFDAPVVGKGQSDVSSSGQSDAEIADRLERLEERLKEVLEEREKAQTELVGLKAALSEVSGHLLTIDSALKVEGRDGEANRAVSSANDPVLERLNSKVDALSQRFDAVAKNYEQISQSEMRTADAQEIRALREQVRRHEELLLAVKKQGQQVQEAIVTSDTGNSVKSESKQFRWVLRSATAGQAWVSLEGQAGQRRVVPGDVLNGVGRIQTIKKVGEQWVVEGTESSIQ